MGLNMPARTVVFTAVRKFDGAAFRWISSGEYIQMSGRAGRRGLDDKGIVIQMIDEKMEPAIAKDMLRGTPSRRARTFRPAAAAAQTRLCSRGEVYPCSSRCESAQAELFVRVFVSRLWAAVGGGAEQARRTRSSRRSISGTTCCSTCTGSRMPTQRR